MIFYWKVTFTLGGAIDTVEQVAGPENGNWIIVEAPSRERAKRKAYSLYCARKKKLARERNLSAGNCACGRPQDRVYPDGAKMRVCSTCAERQKGWNKNYYKRKEEGTVGRGIAERDEAARISLNLERQRDRRSEIRLETLVHVRTAWLKAPNVGRFTKWLDAEIKSITGFKKVS